ncbi:MAG: PEGA domain-containing protein [Candidatus Saccharimonadales bacterium]
MIHIDLSSKRARMALRFFTYGVMTFATVTLTSLAILFAMGYRFNQDSLAFEQGGLMQFRSTPEGATITLDGKAQRFKTPGRANVPAGTHTVGMSLNGYHAWNKTVSLQPGQLLWLNYVRFIPTSVTTSPIRSFEAMAGAMASPDRRWLLLHEKVEQPTFAIVDVADEKNPQFTNITIPDSQLTKKDDKFGQFSIVEWDLGSRYMLIKHQNGDVTEFIRIDRTRPQEATNISQLFQLNIIEAHFAGSTPNVIYAKTSDVLRRLDISASSASAALVTNLRQFVVYGDDTVAFVAEQEETAGNPASKQQVVGIYERDEAKIARTFPLDNPIRIAYAEYFQHTYLAVSDEAGVTQLIRDPQTSSSKQVTKLELGKRADWLKFSNNGRMLVSGSGNSLLTYDLELNETYTKTLDFGVPITQPLNWLDDYYLWTDAGGRLRVVEFDGTNDHEITTVAPGYIVNLSQNGRALFSIDKNTVTNTFVLQSSKLFIED